LNPSEKDWLSAFPINEMRKYTWLPDTKVKHILVDNLLKFFSVASTDEWERIYVDEEVSVAYKFHWLTPKVLMLFLHGCVKEKYKPKKLK
jgi:hypothetical protein